MIIIVIDGQGGGMGKAIINELAKSYINIDNIEIIAVGTNAVATQTMLKAGATAGATGENALVYNCKNADIIIGPIGICFKNSLRGEISQKMADAISSSNAQKILIPISKCKITVVGVTDKTLSQYIEEAINIIKQITESNF